MFGRGKTGMSENNKFIMAKGRQVGNLKGPPKMAAKSPMKMPHAAQMIDKGRATAGAAGKILVPQGTLQMRRSGRGR